MPSLKTHLAIAQKLNQELNLCDNQFYLGNLLPDLTTESNHKKFHFSENKVPNIQVYLENFKDSTLTTIEIGYLCHLLADKFYNEFIFKKYIERDHNKLVSITINGIKHFESEETINHLKHSVYETYDNYLLKNNLVKPLNSLGKCTFPALEGITFDEVLVKNMWNEMKDDINRNAKKDSKINFVFSDQTELDDLFEECCNHILKFLKENFIQIKPRNTVIGIDFDGTIADFYGFQEKYVLEHYGLKIKNPKATSFLDRFGVEGKDIGYSEEDHFDLYFENVETKPNSKETINLLSKMGFSIYIITNRSELRKKHLEDYLKNHDIKYDKIFCLDRRNRISKLDKLIELKVQLMIEDHPYQVESISKGLKVICIDDDYNRGLEGKNIFRIKNWNEALEIVQKELLQKNHLF